MNEKVERLINDVCYTANKHNVMNYPPTAKLMNWASEVNASLRFCFVSDCIPQLDNMFIPCFSIFFAAFTSLFFNKRNLLNLNL